ncbi:MAG: hypothetical protein LBQ47_03885 [Endomicrobium sp.]|jgi:uncharacterized protein (DUF1778 family)|nr:hypothetical protein [Endomicrobium sp.]
MAKQKKITKNKVLRARVSETEYLQVAAAAEKEGRELSNYIRVKLGLKK